MGRQSCIVQVDSMTTRVLKRWKREAEGESQREISRCYAAGIGDGGRDYKPRDRGDF